MTLKEEFEAYSYDGAIDKTGKGIKVIRLSDALKLIAKVILSRNEYKLS